MAPKQSMKLRPLGSADLKGITGTSKSHSDAARLLVRAIARTRTIPSTPFSCSIRNRPGDGKGNEILIDVHHEDVAAQISPKASQEAFQNVVSVDAGLSSLRVMIFKHIVGDIGMPEHKGEVHEQPLSMAGAP